MVFLRLICLSVFITACSGPTKEDSSADVVETDSVISFDLVVDVGTVAQDILNVEDVFWVQEVLVAQDTAQDIAQDTTQDTAEDVISDVEVVVEKCINEQFADRLAPLVANTCSLCHTNQGLAATSGLTFASLDSGLGTARDATNRERLLEYLNTRN